MFVRKFTMAIFLLVISSFLLSCSVRKDEVHHVEGATTKETVEAVKPDAAVSDEMKKRLEELKTQLGISIKQGAAIEELSKMGESVVPFLVTSLDKAPEWEWGGILEVLARIPGREAKIALLDILKKVCEQPPSVVEVEGVPPAEHPVEVGRKRFVAFQITKTGEAGLPVVKERIGKAEGEYKKWLFLATGYMGDMASYDAVAGYLQNDKSPYIREFSAYALGKIGDKRAIPLLEKALRDDFYFDLSKPARHSDIIYGPGPASHSYIVREAAAHGLKDLGVAIERTGSDIRIKKK